MKNYVEHIQNKSPHERRQHAVRIASVVTLVIFVGWLATLGVRIGNHQEQLAKETPGHPSQETQLANVINGVSPISGTDNTLEVASTSVYFSQ